MEYEATIGLEVHAELRTKTKMFCNSANDPFAAEPNVHVCPVCMAHPGTLPVINGEAVRHVLRVGIALGSTLADYTEFDRKNYFYPDLPKGYQLSQFEFPLVKGGELAGVSITRVHLEEDTASSIHDDATGTTAIDYNRAGVPLMELVTEPVMHSAEEAGNFARQLQLLLRYLGVSEANMEKGEMRVEANVSVAPKGDRSAAYVEIKNLNSFRTMEKAILYEIQRQKDLLQSGGSLQKQTLGWDEVKQATFPQRSKEGSADYRYFPDPDLPSLRVSEIPAYSRDALSAEMPELPWQRRERYLALGVKPDDADTYVRERRFGDFFDAVSANLAAGAALVASNYVANDLIKMIRDAEARDSALVEGSATMPDPEKFRALMNLVYQKKVSSRAAKDILLVVVGQGVDPQKYAEEQGLMQESDSGALEAVVTSVIDQNPSVVAEYKAGKESVLEFLLGQCMKALRGAGDPGVLRTLLREKLS